MPELPAKVWGKIVARVPLPASGSRSIGDLKSLRLVSRSMNAEVVHAHQQLVDRAASGAARKFLLGDALSLSVEEKNILRAARSLDLSNIALGSATGARLKMIFELTTQLQRLNLSRNDIGAAGARDLPLRQLVGLQTLNLSWNRIGAAGARDLPIRQLVGLRTLKLESNNILNVEIEGDRRTAACFTATTNFL